MPKIYLCHGVKGKRRNGVLSFTFPTVQVATEFQVQERIYEIWPTLYVCAGDELRIPFDSLHTIKRLNPLPEWTGEQC